MIQLINISKRYKEKIVLNKLNVVFFDKGLFLIKGFNGSGKTTLLNIISFVDKKIDGKILINNIDFSNLSNIKKDLFRKKNIFFINPKENLFSFLNCDEYLNFKNRKIDDELIKGIDINKRYDELSGGEEILLVLTKAINSEKQILLLDEITSQLDFKNTNKIMQKLLEISKKKLIILVTHDSRLLDKYDVPIYELEEGKLYDRSKKYKL